MERRNFLHNLGALGVGVMLPASVRNRLRVGVVGVGGAGGNVISYLTERISSPCRSLAINTHAGALHRSNADRKILVCDIPDEPIRSNDPRRLVRLAVRYFARTEISEISEAVAGLDMVLLVAGMGGLAGTEISPIVAQVLREQNIFTLGFPILPFDFEGQTRNKIALQGAAELGQHVHCLFPIFNDTFAKAAGESATMDDVFSQASLAILQHYQRVRGAVAASRLTGTNLLV
jgi:cell division protein FtsZ